jgi:AcrR family transcriptional regulator
MGAPKRLSQLQLLKVSAELFGERGFHNTSVTDLTDALKISRPTLYSYTKSKQDLLAAVYGQLLEFYSERLSAFVKASDPPYRRIEGFFRLQQLAIREHRAAVVLAFRNLNSTSAVHREILRAWSKRLDQFLLTTIEEGQRLGEFDRSISPTVFKHALLAILNNMPLWPSSVEKLPAEEILRQVMRLAVGPRAAAVAPLAGAATESTPSSSFAIRASSRDAAEASAWWTSSYGREGASLQDVGLALARWTCEQASGRSDVPLTSLSVQWLRHELPAAEQPLELRCAATKMGSGERSSTWHVLLHIPAFGAEAFAAFQLTWIATAKGQG